MKKAKIKNEDVTLNFRVPRELKGKIIRRSEELNLTVSHYIREILERVHDTTSIEPNIEAGAKEFVYSKRFLKLIVWIYSKRDAHKRTDFDTSLALEDYIKTIKEADQHLPSEIIKELDKVLGDLLSMKTATGYDKDNFNFGKSYGSEKGINYEVLNKYFLVDN